MPESSGGGFSLINLGELSKPATVLIEKVSEAVGGIARPWQIKRVAKAEAEADIIKANSRVDISEIERRGLVRLVREEGIKQENIEQITYQAASQISPDAKPENMEKDWIAHFFDRCRLTSDTDMQKLWANVLSGEANNPGTYSRRTVDFLATLDKVDAQLFSRLCNYVWWIGSTPCLALLRFFREEDNPTGLSFADISHLEYLGLLKFDTVGVFVQKFQKPPAGPVITSMTYAGALMFTEFPTNNFQIDLGCALFTRLGTELSTLCPPKPEQKYFLAVMSHWVDQGYRIWSSVPERLSSPPAA